MRKTTYQTQAVEGNDSEETSGLLISFSYKERDILKLPTKQASARNYFPRKEQPLLQFSTSSYEIQWEQGFKMVFIGRKGGLMELWELVRQGIHRRFKRWG